MKLQSKVALVTGAASGIGRAIALLFAREGAAVLVADVNEEGGREVVREMEAAGGRGRFLRTDTSREEEVKAAIAAARETFGRLDVVVNNAGIGGPGYTWDQIIAVNLAGVYYGCLYALPVLREQGGGSIINMASIAGLGGARIPGAVGGYGYAYIAAKHGVIGLTRQFALDGAPTVRVNAICPGWIETPLTRLVWETEALREWVVQTTPLGRFGRPEEIAQGALFLASDDSSFMTGAVLVLDGGWTAY